MTLALTAGADSLIQLGVSISDIALLIDVGRKVGNWFRASSTDNELLAHLSEDSEALIARPGLVDQLKLNKRWSRLHFIYEGEYRVNILGDGSTSKPEELSKFTWAMVIVCTALRLCLRGEELKVTIMDMFGRLLGRSKEEGLQQSLRLLLSTNMEAWRSVEQVRGLSGVANKAFQRHLKLAGDKRLSGELNEAERLEMVDLLVWLLGGKTNEFYSYSAMVFAAVGAMGNLGFDLLMDDKASRGYETQPLIRYVGSEASPTVQPAFFGAGLGGGMRAVEYARQLAFPQGDPSALIDSITGDRTLVHAMHFHWMKGEEVAEHMSFYTSSNGAYHQSGSEISYFLESEHTVKGRFQAIVSVLARSTFPVETEEAMLAIEGLLESEGEEEATWLHQHIELEYLEQTRETTEFKKYQMDLWLKYQALLFGFYYRLFDSLLCSKSKDRFIQKDSFFTGIWGFGSTTFLTACRKFTDTMRGGDGVTRAHVLYMLASMYNGRQKRYDTSSGARGLLGILGHISILSKPLLQATDEPKEIMKFIVTDLPIIDLMAETDGELYGGLSGGLQFSANPGSKVIRNANFGSPEHKWTLHAKMGVLLGQGGRGVVMAARCGGVLVGWFDPLAADVAFLNANGYYVLEDEGFGDDDDGFGTAGYKAFEVKDSDWQKGVLPSPTSEIGIIHSRGSPELRYAAAGFLMDFGIEMAIANGDLQRAYGRVEGQDSGGFVVA
ncbi:hypothetical protein BJ508DRAFT_310356 [Ascobolus immersus RN42]|uniref:Uncharacterized protein n=1 Tax=Ascobolus immersus RN42 TaxID=1160509 RepID=A0A3N4HU28_ASCIM|nr:hypothetical protein BJ508DRAFT_310356 [Ascobolus immersus RN42]